MSSTGSYIRSWRSSFSPPCDCSGARRGSRILWLRRVPCNTWVARFIPITPLYHGGRFVVRQPERGNRLVATPLLVALLIVETTDIVFALDSHFLRRETTVGQCYRGSDRA